jgi:hypothetical protein
MSEILPKYSFLPWLRQGIANQINLTDNLANGASTIPERVTIGLQVKVKGDGNLVSSINTDVKLIGPGDIIGVSPNAIIKTEPLNWITNFEPNYFPYVEFYDEDFPWRYTPAAPTASHKLRPWLTLVVLKESEFTKNVAFDGVLPSIDVPGALNEIPFPNHEEIWAWTHVHVNADLHTDSTELTPSNPSHVNAGIDRMVDLIQQDPDIAISRMLCPRELEPNTDYYAFLIPSFETGRLAGLGINSVEIATIDAQSPSWGLTNGTIHNSAHLPNRWPVYHEWYFKTGAAGDFEYLVRQIVPRILDPRVGKRPMDIQNPGYLLNHSILDNSTLQLEGALRIPGNDGEPYPWSAHPDSEQFRIDLQNLVNLGENVIGATFAEVSNSVYNSLNFGDTSIADDPIVAPPLYGRWHALKKTVNATNTTWIHELNLDPRNRVAAGIGTSVIQKDQDKFMDMAWEQVGEVIEANKKLKWAQVAKEVSFTLFKRHILSQPKEEKLQLTAKLHKKIKSTSGGTIFKKNLESILPVASESKSFRKIRRTNGPLMRRIDPFKIIANSFDTQHITARMSNDLAPIQTAKPKKIALLATKTPVNVMDGVIGFSSTINNSSYLFKLTNPGETLTQATTNAEAESFKSAIQVFENHFIALNWQPELALPAFDLQLASDDIDTKADPRKTLPARMYHEQQIGFSKPYNFPPADKIVPILAAPSFRQPMYEAVRDLSTDLLIPNLNLITQNTISLLETNQKFIESYMVGLNHEMGRELLWREYPTDQRGTYFKHFWDATDFIDQTELLTDKQIEDKVSDITEIHTWLSTSQLGSHNNRSSDGGSTPEAKLVLVIRGDLLKKYPSAVIYAQRAEWHLKTNGDHDYSKPRKLALDSELYPIFGAKIDPDINFIGFDLTACEAKGGEILDTNAPTNSYDPGYFFIIKERPGEPRFGADLSDPSGDSDLENWNDLRWDHIQKNNSHVLLTGGTITISDNKIPTITGLEVNWSSSATSADIAMVAFQNPVLVAIHAKEMLNVECP